MTTNDSQRGEAFSGPFRITFFTGFGLIAFYAIVNLILTVWSVREHSVQPLVTMAFAARLIQVSLGMMIGFFTIFLGMLAAWMGIESRFNLAGQAPGYGVTLASASPGILLILAGTFLVGICLIKPIEIIQSRVEETAEPTVRRAQTMEGPPPEPLRAQQGAQPDPDKPGE